VLVGSAVYLGRWLPAAKRFVDSHRAELTRVPVWLFSSGPLGVPPRPVDHLSEVTALGASVAARGHEVFGGRLDPDGLSWAERVAVRAVHAAAGDFLDHEVVRSWAHGVAGDLAGALTTR